MKDDLQLLSLDAFPPLLMEIPHPPRQLMVRGELPPYDLKWLAVVGSRKYSSYGKAACLDWSVLYPRTNHALAKEILHAGGALLSEFEPGERAAQFTFPKRNRIMAGMSHATLLVEAEERSGTLITARLAADYNRELLAVPGSIFSSNTAGTHQFLKLGARAVTDSADILDALGLGAETDAASPAVPLPLDLTAHEADIFTALASPLSRDELIESVNLPAMETAIALSTLELKGLIVEELGLLRRS